MEYSVVLGVSHNWKNTHTDYKNGIDSHLDWAISRFVSPEWELGVAGYAYYQLTGDSGSGAILGPFPKLMKPRSVPRSVINSS
jgi:hypothetical protein